MRIAILLSLLVPSLSELRTWTDATGKLRTQADLVEAHDGMAYLKRDGRVKPIPVAKLSAEDQKHIQFVFPIKTVAGKVTGVSDGGTLTLLEPTKRPYKIRLHGVGAPKFGQAFGTQSRDALRDKIFRKSVTVEWEHKDQLGHILGHVFIDGRWINREQLAEGMARHSTEYGKSELLSNAELEARKAGRGIWADKSQTAQSESRTAQTTSRLPDVTETITKPVPVAVAASDRSSMSPAQLIVGEWRSATADYAPDPEYPNSREYFSAVSVTTKSGTRTLRRENGQTESSPYSVKQEDKGQRLLEVAVHLSDGQKRKAVFTFDDTGMKAVNRWYFTDEVYVETRHIYVGSEPDLMSKVSSNSPSDLEPKRLNPPTGLGKSIVDVKARFGAEAGWRWTSELMTDGSGGLFYKGTNPKTPWMTVSLVGTENDLGSAILYTELYPDTESEVDLAAKIAGAAVMCSYFNEIDGEELAARIGKMIRERKRLATIELQRRGLSSGVALTYAEGGVLMTLFVEPTSSKAP